MAVPSKRRRLLHRWTGLSVIVLAATVTWAISNRKAADKPVLPGADVEGLTAVLKRDLAAEAAPIRFEDVTLSMNVDFRHAPVPRSSLLPEDMGSGVACGDYDDDGFVDLYFVNISGNVGPDRPQDLTAGRARLYRNVRGERFEDVTDRTGVGFVGCGMGAAWGDFDNDDDLDLYVTAYGNNALYENLGDGTFRDATERCGAQDPRFSAGCSWGDYDRDGHIDLYVCNYVAFVFREADRGRMARQYATEQPYTLNPSAYAPQANALFRNRGDGTFEEVAAAAGVADPNGRSLSASWVDLDNDGWADLYVANDVSANGVFRNRRDGTFEDIGPSSLAADYRGAMGIAAADIDDDEDQDLLITHWIAQENALYCNMLRDASRSDPDDQPAVWFFDSADRLGLGQVSLDMVGWATGFCDFDNDGQRDLWIVNGSTLEDPGDHRRLLPQPALVFWNRGADGFVDVARQASERLARPFVGRGGVQVDLDLDGGVDLVLLQHGGPAVILSNRAEPPGHWLRVELRQKGRNTRALGARAYATVAGRTRMAEIGCSSSYLSQDELTLHFGLGAATRVDVLRIVWPDGAEETHRDVSADRTVRYSRTAAYPGRSVDAVARGPRAFTTIRECS